MSSWRGSLYNHHFDTLLLLAFRRSKNQLIWRGLSIGNSFPKSFLTSKVLSMCSSLGSRRSTC